LGGVGGGFFFLGKVFCLWGGFWGGGLGGGGGGGGGDNGEIAAPT
jgi:hypothetical protein